MNGILYGIFGNLTLRCEGGFVGQFLDLCRRGGVAFRKARCKDGKLYINITPAELYTVRHIARETGMRVRILRRSGLVFTLRRYRKRGGMIAGFIVFMLIMYHLSGFVWSVDIVGESRYYTEEEILASLEQNGIGVGKRIDVIDVSRAENSILNSLNRLKRLAVSIDSTSVTVEIADRVLQEEEDEDKTGMPCNIVSDSDAYIVSVVPYAGEAAVSPGDTVRKGQILVNGMFEDSVGRTYLTEAKAEIIGQVTREAEFEVSIYNEEAEHTGEEFKKISLFFYGINIKFYSEGGNRYPKCDIIAGKRQASFLNTLLPISVTTVTERELAVDSRLLTEEELALKTEKLLKSYETESLSGEIVSRSLKTEIKGDVCYVSATYVCNERIGEKAEIIIE